VNATATRYAWYCPIYWWESSYNADADEYYISDIKLHALGIADAVDVTRAHTEVVSQADETLLGADLVQAVREGYIDAVGGEVITEIGDTFELNATIMNITTYVENGDTHIVLGTDNSTYGFIEGARDWMVLDDWYTLLNLSVSDSFTATIQIVNDQNRILAIVKN
jgi:hypothetical protein